MIIVEHWNNIPNNVHVDIDLDLYDGGSDYYVLFIIKRRDIGNNYNNLCFKQFVFLNEIVLYYIILSIE